MKKKLNKIINNQDILKNAIQIAYCKKIHFIKMVNHSTFTIIVK